MKRKWMRRAAAFLLAGAVCLGLAGCGAKVEFDTAACEAQAEEILKNLQTGKFEAVTAQAEAQTAKKLTAQALREGWEKTVEPLGEWQRHVSTQSVEKAGMLTVVLLEAYENNGLQLNITFNGKKQITGLWMVYAEAPAAPGEGEGTLPQGLTEREVSFAADEKFPLTGTLTLPAGEQPAPVVILVHGSGQSDRDETISGNKPFRDIAWGLARQGVAVLRYDKRYYTYAAQADAAALTLREEVLDDVAAAIAFAKADERLDAGSVFVLGHSLGGMLVPAIAAENEGLAGAISMAGSLRPLWEISYDQNRQAAAAATAAGLTQEQRGQLQQQLKQVEQDVAVLRDLKSSDLKDTDTLLGLPVKYWRSLDEYQGMNFIDQISLPLLILQGEADFQVSAEKDYPLWQQTLKDRPGVAFRLYPGLNHLMMPTQGKQDISEYAVKAQVSPEVIDAIAAFVKGGVEQRG